MDQWRSIGGTRASRVVVRGGRLLCSVSTRILFRTLLVYEYGENRKLERTLLSRSSLTPSHFAFIFFVTFLFRSFLLRVFNMTRVRSFSHIFFYVRSYFCNIPLICHKYHSRVLLSLTRHGVCI